MIYDKQQKYVGERMIMIIKLENMVDVITKINYAIEIIKNMNRVSRW